MSTRTSRDDLEPASRKERETREAIVADADENDGKDRVLVHGDGRTIGIPNPNHRS